MAKCSKAEVRRLKTALHWKIPAAQRQRIQMVLLREWDNAACDCRCDGRVAEHGEPCAHGLRPWRHQSLKAQTEWRTQTREYDPTEEKVLLARFAKAVGAGEMLNIHDLKAAYEKAIGHATSDSTVYNLLHRHGWRKLMPRPFHPKRDLAAQNAFKKTAFLML